MAYFCRLCAYLLIAKSRQSITPNDTHELFENHSIYAVDTTTIDLCLNVFWWAKFRKNKGAIRLHTVLDIKTEIPCFIHITDGKTHEVNVLDEIEFEANGFYIMDRGFIDYERLYSIHNQKAFFVTRAKTNMKCRRIYSARVDKSTGVRYDQTIKLENVKSLHEYPEKFRRVKYYDAETDKTFIFLTNNIDLSALEIALLYKHRWKIELFFKWIKQHLKVKSFWGHSENAVRVQIYVAIITFVTVAYMKHKLEIPLTQYQILQILSLTLLNKTPLNQLLSDPNLQNQSSLECNQLELF